MNFFYITVAHICMSHCVSSHEDFIIFVVVVVDVCTYPFSRAKYRLDPVVELHNDLG